MVRDAPSQSQRGRLPSDQCRVAQPTLTRPRVDALVLCRPCDAWDRCRFVAPVWMSGTPRDATSARLPWTTACAAFHCSADGLADAWTRSTAQRCCGAAQFHL